MFRVKQALVRANKIKKDSVISCRVPKDVKEELLKLKSESGESVNSIVAQMITYCLIGNKKSTTKR